MAVEWLNNLKTLFIVVNVFFSVLFVLLIRRYPLETPDPPQDEILLVTAHPDDESMFFTPFLLSCGHRVHLLCASNGDHKGKYGRVREKELEKVKSAFGIRSTVIPSGFQDGEEWDVEKLAREIAKEIKKRNVTKVVTFDEEGVSGHRNHVAVYQAVKKAVKEDVKEDVNVYTLKSVPWVLKYSGLIGWGVLAGMHVDCTVFQVSWNQLLVARKMMALHASQFVWYRRWIWVFFSSYNFVNVLNG